MQPSSSMRPWQHGLYWLLALFFLLSWFITLWMSFYSPVNTDEIFWKMMISRLDSDSGHLVYLFAQCREGQWLDAPLTWYPAMALHGFFYEDASRPWLLRLHGFCLFISLIAAWTWLLHQRSGLSWSHAFLAISASLSVGVMPFLMVYARPEQPVLILLTLALLTTVLFPSASRRPPVLGCFFITLGFALCAALLAGTHPKGLFIFPVLLVLAWRLLKSSLWMTLLIGTMAWIAYDTQTLWQQRTHCPEFPGLHALLQNLTLRPNSFFQDPLQFIHDAWTNIIAFDAYVQSIAFLPNYVVNWLPTAPTAWQSQSSSVIIANALLVMPLCLAALLTANNWLSPRRPRTLIDVLLWLTLATALLAIVVLQTAKNFYEASLIWPLVLLVAVFSFGQRLHAPASRRVHGIIALLMAIAILSGWVRFERFYEDAQQWQSQRAFDKHHTDDLNTQLRQFAQQQCGIDQNAKRLILDKDSYQAFWPHEQPIFLDYAAGWWGAESDIAVTAQWRRSEGLVARCSQVPEVFRSLQREGHGLIDGYCCVAPSSLHPAALTQ